MSALSYFHLGRKTNDLVFDGRACPSGTRIYARGIEVFRCSLHNAAAAEFARWCVLRSYNLKTFGKRRPKLREMALPEKMHGAINMGHGSDDVIADFFLQRRGV